MRIKVEIDICDYQRWSRGRLMGYLHSQGLDITKEIMHYECPTRHYSRIFIGESLADKVIGCLRTVIGLVPITEPWSATGE